MLYESPCDSPCYSDHLDEDSKENFDNFNYEECNDYPDELLEVCWESPR